MFGFLVTIFDAALYYPLFNLLVVIYNYLPGHDFGLAIIFLTVIIRVFLYPLSVKALNSQRALQKLQPQLQEIQKKHKNDKEAQAKETLELYKKEKINPFSGLLLALVQLPVLIALYRVFWNGFKVEELGHLYDFVVNPGQIGSLFLGVVDLAAPNVIFAVLAGILQFFQTKMIMPPATSAKSAKPEFSAIMQKQMVYVFPVITVVILFKLPSALGLYWIASSAFSIVQQYYILKSKKVAVNL